MASGETLPLDRRIVELTGKAHPRALFLPTASFDSRDYWESFKQTYAASLGCSVDVLFLWDRFNPEEIEATIQATKWNDSPHTWEFRGDRRQVEDSIEKADLVYVGGGNTKRMIEMWRSIGVDALLKRAAERGTVLAGLSAGCICWARFGNSDFALTEDLGRPTGRADCLGFLPLSMCPHMSREAFRLEEFQAMMQETPGVGLGIDDCAALEYVDGSYRIVACTEGAVAHRITANSHEIIEPFDEMRDFGDLLV